MMSVDGRSVKQASLDAIDCFSLVADFLSARPDYLVTVVWFNILTYLGFSLLAGLAILLLLPVLGVLFAMSQTYGVLAALALIAVGATLLPLVLLLGILGFYMFNEGFVVGFVDMLMKRQKPSLGALFSSMGANVELIIQLTITALVSGIAFSALSLLFGMCVWAINLMLPIINLTLLGTSLVIIPAAIILNFGLTIMTVLYFQGKRGWTQLPQQALSIIMRRKEEFAALGLGLSFILSSLLYFFNGGILFLFVYLLLTLPLSQCMMVLVPYFAMAKKKA